MSVVRILIADDQLLIRDSLRIILDAEPDLKVVGTAENGEEAIGLVRTQQPDILLLDIEMPVLSGIEALKVIKKERPETIVLMLTTFDPDEYIFGAFENGADGYLLKDLSGRQLVDRIRDAAAGDVLIPASIAARLIAQIPRETRRQSLEDYGLTAREMEIAGFVKRGYDNHKIANTLQISQGTAKNYISILYSKLEVKNRKEAICLMNSMDADITEGRKPEVREKEQAGN